MNERAFVTGGTGLLGSNLVRELAGRGWHVRVLARSREKMDRVLGDVAAEAVIGDIENVGGFAPALEGCDTLFHCAAYFREYYSAGDHRQKLERINVKGTLEIFNQGRSAGIKKIVYVSSSGVLGHSGNTGTIDESAPYSPDTTNLYFQSKIQAEQKVMEWLKSNQTPVVLILPGWMFGPFDLAPTASGQLVLDYLARKIPGIVSGGACVVDARRRPRHDPGRRKGTFRRAVHRRRPSCDIGADLADAPRTDRHPDAAAEDPLPGRDRHRVAGPDGGRPPWGSIAPDRQRHSNNERVDAPRPVVGQSGTRIGRDVPPVA